MASYQFTLDGNGNRTNVVQNEPLMIALGVGTTPYTYNAQKNRLLSAGAKSFNYDTEGQLYSGYGTSYTFDYEHRLTGIGSDQFFYDGSGNRLQAIRNGVTTRYIYGAGGNLLAEADGSGNITKYYIHGLGLLAMVTPSDQTYCYHFNAIGSTIAMTDQSQTVVNTYAYDPFGKIASQVEAVPQPFKFVGRHGVMTEPNGFYYMRARYYDPGVGRFISEDPIGFEGKDVNLMGYVGNNPVLGVDPSGLELRVYNRPVDGGILADIGANHAFVCSTVTGQCWGTSGSSGSNVRVQADKWHEVQSSNLPYNIVANPQNIPESKVMNYMETDRNSGPYIPGVRDCHSAVNRALNNSGLENPGAPGGRLGSLPNCGGSACNAQMSGTSSYSGGSGK